MAEFAFERELDRMFAEAPAFADAPLFALKVEERLDRGWTARRLMIGAFGLAGGLIGGAQLMGSGIAGQLHEVPAFTHRLLATRIEDLIPPDLLPSDLPLSIEAIGLAGALALVAVGFAITRAIREF